MVSLPYRGPSGAHPVVNSLAPIHGFIKATTVLDGEDFRIVRIKITNHNNNNSR
jgi:hypothetical protein